MTDRSPVAQARLDPLLLDVDKPARYTGGELNSVVKPGPVRARMALCFPDVYEVAESHIGLKILYSIVNNAESFAAERCYAVWPDFEAQLRQADVPLYALESRRPLAAFDVVGFTLQYELSFPTLVAMLELGRIPVRSEARGDQDPFVIGGGTGAFNPEPVAPFFDAFLLGDGEDAVLDILEVVAEGRRRQAPRAEVLIELARIPGLYVPSHVQVDYDGIGITAITARDDSPHATERSKHGTPRITRRAVLDLDSAPYPTRPIVPNVSPVHERVAVEIQRGCSQSCRFCQAGMITRPTRQRKPETVLKLADEALQASGCSTVGLLSLSAGDYGPINQVLEAFFRRYHEERIGVSLPSMRTETMSPELAQRVAKVRKSSWTFAPEAGSERMRRVINKTNSEEDLMAAVRATVEAGWRRLKFYFMIGLPTETDEDVDAIAELAERARKEARRVRGDADITVSVSTFVPKPHTPFQWEGQIDVATTRARHDRLRDYLRPRRIDLRWHSPEQSYLEGVLSRGDRRLADAIERAAAAGCRLDAWTEHYDHARWMTALTDALAPHGLVPDDYLQERNPETLLPWDHLDAGILKKFLLNDRKRAHVEATILDCAFSDQCYACGGCDIADPYLSREQRDNAKTREAEDALHPRVFKPTAEPLALPSPPSGATGRTASTAVARSRLRVRYAKLGRAVHLSHLDSMEQMLRAIRQSEVAVLYSEGHTPRPRVGFSPACPTGLESQAEYVELECSGFPDGKKAAEAIGRFLPDGLLIVDAIEVPREKPAFNELLEATVYRCRLPEDADLDVVRARIEELLGSESLPVRIRRKKKAKLVDARRHLLDLALVGRELELTLAFGRRGTLKPVEALTLVLGRELAPRCVVRKESVRLADEVRPQEEPEVIDGKGAVDLTDVAERRPSAPPKRRGGARAVPYSE